VTQPSPRAAAIVLAIVLGALALWVALSPPGANDVVGGDEGYYGVMARNVIAHARYLVSPSQSPLGPPGDKPPLYPAMLALSVRLLGPTAGALRWPSLALAAVVALATAAFVARAAGVWGAIATALLLVSLPWFADSSRVASAEIPLTAFGTLALALLARGSPSPRRAFGAGALLGLAFLCKLWLVALIALPAVAMLVPATAAERPGDWRALLALVAGAVLVGALQLVAVAIVAPRHLAHWASIYLGFSLASRVAGEGYTSGWIKPPSYYVGVLGHAFVLLLPFVALGAWQALRRFREPVPRAILVWALGFVLLSAFSVKSGVYLYPIVPAWVALAALGLDWIARSSPRIAMALAALVAIAGLMREVQRLPLRYHRPGYREVAAALEPVLRDAPVERASYLAPEAPAFGYLLFRTGRYWGTPGAPWSPEQLMSVASDSSLRAFVVDPSRNLYGGWPDSTVLAWLELGSREITGEIEDHAGRKIDVRVFVRNSP
jgi:4-amino-4-deoxy-L-arabinose transferase-like glycosyltransferase